MKQVVTLIICLTLASCGVDGEPIKPSVNAGVTINQHGISPSASVGVGRGPLSVWLGL